MCQTRSFCLTCLVSYFTLLITEGLVESVHCPDLACVKNRSQQAKNGFTGKERVGDVTKQELVEIVGEDLVKRWERLAEKKLIESGSLVSSLWHNRDSN